MDSAFIFCLVYVNLEKNQVWSIQTFIMPKEGDYSFKEKQVFCRVNDKDNRRSIDHVQKVGEQFRLANEFVERDVELHLTSEDEDDAYVIDISSVLKKLLYNFSLSKGYLVKIII